ncbi:MAG: hypothetical protein ACRD1U_02310 [Vicinamibacterales bacterium]
MNSGFEGVDLATPEREDAQRAWRFKQLRRSLRGLSDAGSGQQSLFQDRGSSADDLAFDFDHWSSVIRGTYGDELTAAQSSALDAIARKLATMSRDGAEFDVELWTDAAMRSNEHWLDVRQLAASGLEAFGWASAGAVVDPPEPVEGGA